VYKEKGRVGGESGEQPLLEHLPPSEGKSHLLECIEQNVETLLKNITLYSRRIGLGTEGEQRGISLEILQETVVIALAHADRFTTTRQPLAWLLGIAVNVIKRKKVELAKHSRREILLGSLVAQNPPLIGEEELLDQILSSSFAEPEPGQTLENEEEIEAILSLASPRDQQIVRLAVIEDLDGETLAQQLGISVGTARMRLSRALQRLRLALLKQQKNGRKGEHHE
jgi:RNA polymerase sigma factor (sigma-70 family)